MIATERLYRTADDQVVPEGHPDAAFLLCIPGDEVPAEYAEGAAAIGVELDVDRDPEAETLPPADEAEKVGPAVDEGAVEKVEAVPATKPARRRASK